MSWPEPYRTWASAEVGTPRDVDPARRRRRPRRAAHAPPPAPRPPALAERRRRHDRRPGARRRARPRGASRTAGTPRMKLWVAVDRVDVPAGRRVAGLGAVLLADEAVIRVRRADPAADRPLDRRVGLGHERPIGLGRISRSRRNAVERDRVGLVAGGVGEREPRVELRRRTPRRSSARPGRPVGPRRPPLTPGSARSSGRRAARASTSKPIHSPKTSISPRVPIGASGGQVGVGDRALDGVAVAAATSPGRRSSPSIRTGSLPRQTERGSSRTRQRSRLRGPAAFAATSASRPMKSTPLSSATANPRPGLERRLVGRDVARPDAVALLEPERVDRPIAGRRRGRAAGPPPRASTQSAGRTRRRRTAPSRARRRTSRAGRGPAREPTLSSRAVRNGKAASTRSSRR